MNTADQKLVKEIREAEAKLAAAIKLRNDGMTAYRKAQKEYGRLMQSAATKLMSKK